MPSTSQRNDRIALTHADDPALFVKITDFKRAKWEFVTTPLTDEFTFKSEIEAACALTNLFKTKAPRHIVATKVVSPC